MLRKAIFVAALLASTSAGAQNYPSPRFKALTVAEAFPASVVGNQDQHRFTIGNFPVTSEFGANAAHVYTNLMAGVNVPSTYNGVAPFGIAGYGLSSSPSGAVGVAGFGLVNANGSPAWGGNFGVANCPEITTCVTGHRFNNFVGWGIEVDVGLDSVPAVSNPSFALRGVQFTGDIRMTPAEIGSNVLRAIDIDSPKINQNPRLQWPQAIYTAPGAAITALSVGQSRVGNNAGSQFIILNSTNSGGGGLRCKIGCQKQSDHRIRRLLCA
jgi:hypothetical protein